MTTKTTEQLIAAAVENLALAQTQIKAQVNRHEKVLSYQQLQIDTLEKNVMELRNVAITQELKLGTPAKDVAVKYGISPGRVSQIKSAH
jgi:hypothetical protein